MEPLFALLVIAGGGSVAYLVAWMVSQERGRSWMAAAQAAGLSNPHLSSFAGVTSSLKGEAGPLDVTIETYRRGKYEHGMRITIGGLKHGSYAMTIRGEGVTSLVEKTLGEREIELGDPEFDETAYLQGAPELVRAVFDGETRRLLGRLLQGDVAVEGPAGSRTISKLRASVSDGELRVDIPSSFFNDAQAHLPAILPAIVAIGGRLLRPDDLASRMAANIRHESVAAVRLAGLGTLASKYPDHEATRAALAAALGDDSVEVRLLAATALGPQGRDTLVRLATGDAPDDVAAKAVAALGADFRDLAVATLRKAREAGHAAAALACIDAIGRWQVADAVSVLCDALASEAEAMAAAAARALGEVGGAAVEAPLLAALQRDVSEVRTAAAEALGRAGTPAAVVPLREAAAAHTLDGTFRRAARQAVAEIQSRVTGASPGQISLAADQAGQVSLADEDSRGRLSVAQAARRQTQSGS